MVMVSAVPTEHILEAVLMVSPNNLKRGQVRPAALRVSRCMCVGMRLISQVETSVHTRGKRAMYVYTHVVSVRMYVYTHLVSVRM